MIHPEVDRRERRLAGPASWVLGLLFVSSAVLLPPSCGKSIPSPCSSSCAGCCNAAGECVNNETDTQCGRGGAMCSNCVSQGSKCDLAAHQCLGPSDGGSCGATCPGCCFNGICLPFSAQVRMSCGAGGEACRSCSSEEKCAMGMCVPEPPSVTGNPCMSDGECGSLGDGGECRKLTSTQRYSYPGGYCTKPCMSSSACAHDAICVRVNGEESDALCMPQCSEPNTFSTCREGYLCVGFTVGAGGACWLLEPFLPDAGPPLEKTGQSCMTSTMCNSTATPNGAGFCIPETLRDGGPSGFTGGYCTGDCTMDPRVCGSDGGAVCVPAGPQSYLCEKSCAGPQQGQSDCRPGYVCYGYSVRTPDGGSRPSPTGVCQPNCNVMGGLFACAPGAYCDAGYCVQ